MDLGAFYSIMAGLSFTLLGLWWVACQGRQQWLAEASGRRMAYVVSLHFVLPGAMSILSLIAPDVPAMWRVTFTIAGATGLIGTLTIITTVRRHAASEAGMVRLLQWVALPLYAAVTVVAAFPQVAGGFALAPRQIEAILLVLLVLLGSQSVWLVTFAHSDTPEGVG